MLIPVEIEEHMLCDLYCSEPPEVLGVDEAGGRDGEGVDEEVKTKSGEVLWGQHPYTEEDHAVAEDMVELQEEQRNVEEIHGEQVSEK